MLNGFRSCIDGLTTTANIGIANSRADEKSISIWSRIKQLFGA